MVIRTTIVILLILLSLSNFEPIARASPNSLTKGSNPLSLLGVGQTKNVTMSGPLVQAVPSYQINSTSDQGNTISAQVFGFALNPLKNNDTHYDYYVIDLLADASPAPNWSVDSSGINDANGATLDVEIALPSCPQSQFILSDTSSPTDQSGGINIAIGGSINLWVLSAQITDSFSPPASQSHRTENTQCLVRWISADNELHGRTGDYQYYFIAAVQVPKGQPATVTVQANASFYQVGYPFTGRSHIPLKLTESFSGPPVVTITSNPPGIGIVQLDGRSINTLARYLWNATERHAISANSSIVISGNCYIFSSWSDGLPQTHQVSGPTSTETLVANFQKQPTLSPCELPQTSNGPPTATLSTPSSTPEFAQPWFLALASIISVAFILIIASLFARKRNTSNLTRRIVTALRPMKQPWPSVQPVQYL